MTILISGSTGFIGSALTHHLRSLGHFLLRLVRSTSSSSSEIYWDPEKKILDVSRLEGIEVVIHLAGENVATGRWTKDKKRKILESRVKGTTFLCDSLAQLSKRPKALVSASAIGYYGERGEEFLTEESPPGRGFLAEVCQAWEAATEGAKRVGIRVVHVRIGMVLSPKGGALQKMLFPFKLGLGGKIGTGNQFVSWITLDDLLNIFLHCISRNELQGAVNGVTPNPVTQSQFANSLGKVLKRPAVFPMPAFVARLLLGELADTLLLASTRVKPLRLLETNFKFHFPELEEALRHLLLKTSSKFKDSCD
ncbi:MAG: TIGR01777 family protein [Chlamydiae bacterium]|nr:TIGR01777 family protein [Chlamydiota bacterium]MBI3276566.1 TIGR01777 family protein [Chlamydiota bacterium]